MNLQREQFSLLVALLADFYNGKKRQLRKDYPGLGEQSERDRQAEPYRRCLALARRLQKASLAASWKANDAGVQAATNRFRKANGELKKAGEELGNFLAFQTAAVAALEKAKELLDLANGP